MLSKAVFKCLLATLLLAAAGCNREDEEAIVVQQVPKQPAPSTMPLVERMAKAMKKDGAGALPPGHPDVPTDAKADAAAPSGEVTFADPPGWIKDGPKDLRYASFHLGEGNNLAEITIVSTSQPLSTESRQANINRWRGQVGLQALKEGDPQESKEIIVDNIPSYVFDFSGTDKRQIAVRQLIAWVPRGDVSWFFKISGPKKWWTNSRTRTWIS